MIEVTLMDSAWADVEEGTEALVDEWMVAEGDRVEAGQTLGVVELVKTSHEIAAPSAGIVKTIKVGKQETFGRGQALILLEA
ncbi:MAG TPA: lipoyl domain-containing protein [Noviherbaspirillum sp.]|uniref:lipoyl domain-containing protein n=1 Tax=Noviherbaspirillum sp. TaxID=1926288 RepID=UPI002B495DD6|nr:lipoyl domain-containing protein [Noviherbaspirillum sp.]HJV84072.1 lipoyl domain-containing protein [Noviherbaspirillum sp.]